MYTSKEGDIVLHVSDDFILIVSALMSSGWRIATSFQIPGTNLNIPEFALACLGVMFAIRAVRFLGFGSSAQSSSTEPSKDVR